MGYRKQTTLYHLTFPEFDGLEITAKSLSTGDLMRIMKTAAQLTGDASERPGETRAQAVEDMLRRFSKALVSWNLEDEDGEPVPATYQGVEDQELPFVLRIIEAWTEAVAGVPDDLGKVSPSGPQFPEVSLPMVAL